MRTGPIPECRMMEGAILAIAMRMMTAMVRRTGRAVRNELGEGRERTMSRENGRGLKTKSARGSKRRKRRGKGMGRGIGNERYC